MPSRGDKERIHVPPLYIYSSIYIYIGVCVSVCVFSNSIYIYICIYIHKYMSIYIHTYIHIYIHTYPDGAGGGVVERQLHLVIYVAVLCQPDILKSQYPSKLLCT